MIVALLVAGCTFYAAWKLMPSVARRSLAALMLRMPHLPRALESRLRVAAQAATGSGCDGCDHAQKRPVEKAAAAAQPVTIHRRPRR